MALRVWLPLNGSLENKGLSSTDFGTSTAFASIGKIGAQSAYSNMQKTITCSELTGVTEFSLAYWLKVDSSIAITNWSDIIGLECTVGSNSAIIRDEFTNAVGLHQIIVGKDTSVGSNTYDYYGAGISTSTAKDVWAHFTIAKNATNTYVYVNGVLTVTLTNSNFESSPQQLTGKIYLGNSSSTAAQFNDLRIYDHCLSAKEVKEIAQGLVLHYKLDSPLIKTSQNLVVAEDPFNGATCYNGVTGKYGYGTNTDIYETFGTFQNRKCTKVYMGTNNLDAYPYVYFNAFSAAGSIIHTLSFDYFPSILDAIIPYSYNGTYNWDYKVNGISGTAQDASSITLPVIVGQWNHIEITAVKTDTTNTSRGIGYIRIGSAKHTSNTNNYWLFANIQVEEGPCATAYLGIGGTREGYVTDSSGYGYDGIIGGSFTTTPDSNRYSMSTIFNGTEYITAPTITSGILTLSAWFKTSKNKNTSQFIVSDNSSQMCISIYSGCVIGYYGPSGSQSTGSKCTLGDSYKENDWNHVVVVKTGTGTRDIYCNGVKLIPTTNDYWTANAPNIMVGARTVDLALPFYGEIADVRAYTTALSAEDILDLYHTPANVDNLQQMHTFELQEFSNNILSNSALEQGAIADANGTNSDGNANRIRTLFIPVQPNMSYKVSVNSGFHVRGIHYYTNDLTWISYVNVGALSYDFDTPSNCYYIRFAIQRTDANTALSITDIALVQPTLTTITENNNIMPNDNYNVHMFNNGVVQANHFATSLNAKINKTGIIQANNFIEK